jgi:hypothetical protein
MPKFFKDQEVIHVLTRQLVTIVKIKPTKSSIQSYDVRAKIGGPFDAAEFELSLPAKKEDKEDRRRWHDDEDEEDN